MKNAVFWDVAPCRYCINRRFGGTHVEALRRAESYQISETFKFPEMDSQLEQVTEPKYSDWLWAGRQRGRSSSPSRVKNFLSSTSSRPALRPTQSPIQWVSGAFS
jgi:hypothetical protein